MDKIRLIVVIDPKETSQFFDVELMVKLGNFLNTLNRNLKDGKIKKFNVRIEPEKA